jgi:glycogen synthase
VGDVAEILAETGTGVTVTAFDDATLRDGLLRTLDLTRDPALAARCRAAAADRFSLDHGAATYDRIYRRLSGQEGTASAA